MRLRMYVIAIFCVLNGLWFTPAYAAARCFSETSYCIDGAILTYWQSHGGIMVFGLPIGAATQTTVDGVQISAQLFERNRIELHPNNKAPFDVQLGLLGVDYLAQTTGSRIPQPGTINEVDNNGIAKSARKNCHWFAAPQQYVCGDFYTYWRSHGIASHQRGAFSIAENIALFGLPITGVYQETINNQSLQVQLFERARFEYHPENPVPYRVMLGLLGSEMLSQSHQGAMIPAVTNASATPPFVLADYLATPGILQPQDLVSFRTSMPNKGYWNSDSANDMTVIIRDVRYINKLKGQRASIGMKFMVGIITIVNNRPVGGASIRVHYADLSIVDLEGNWHSSSKITELIDLSLTYKILEPGQRFGGRVAFSVPMDSAPGQLVAQFWQEQPVNIELRVWPHFQ
ncbi:MAG: hypothetical protein NT020_09725 [Chloroflexales bacterium]|nr:hypothetical protein [Chloroflexales bacterium]